MFSTIQTSITSFSSLIWTYLDDITTYFYSNYSVKICSSPNAHLKNPEIIITPNTIRKDEPINIQIKGKLDKLITDGICGVVIKLNGAKILTKTLDLCNLVLCPIGPDFVNIKLKEKIPEYALPGKYNVLITVLDQINEQIICIEIAVKL